MIHFSDRLAAAIRTRRCGACATLSQARVVRGATAPTVLRLVRAAPPQSFVVTLGFAARECGPEAQCGVAAGKAAAFVDDASCCAIDAWQAGGRDHQRAAARAAESMRSDLAHAA